MKKALSTILAILLVLVSTSSFGQGSFYKLLEITKEHKNPPAINGFRYWFGDTHQGEVIYVGENAISGFQTELHVRFFRSKIYSFLLILGPAGMNSDNCLKRYNRITDTLSKKYGNSFSREITKDPIVDDLISDRQCDWVRIGALSIKTEWRVNKFRIISKIIGDQDGFYIETEYIKVINSDSQKDKLQQLL